ncbi:MAG: DNA translocase FtsK 4TM domain-containing protein [Chitinophagales bacterium]|nr:DNA translocase FtsK 4TM domain-containing protein [Chitinophagales bacterium]
MPETTNKLKTKKEKEEEPKEEKPAPAAKKRKKTTEGWFSQIKKDERASKVLGLIFLLISLYLCVAFISYLFTWKTDQDKVFQFTWGNFFSGAFTVENYLGRLGAYLSHFFIYNGFGLTSFVFAAIVFVAGINLLLQKNVFRFSHLWKVSLVALVLLPTAFSFFLRSSGFPFGGAVGNMVVLWLTAFMGTVGTGALLLFSLLVYLVIAFNYSFHFKFLSRKNEAGMLLDSDQPNKVPFTIASEPGSEDAEAMVLKEIIPSSEVTLPLNDDGNINSTLVGAIENLPEQIVEDGVENQIKNLEGKTTTGIALDIVETKEEELVETESLIRENYDPTIDLPKYQYPTLDLLENYGSEKIRIDSDELMRNKDQIVKTLQNYGIEIQSIKATVGPTVTLYEIVPAPGIRISKIKNLEDDIALSLSALGIRIIAPIPGKGTIGIEVPNMHKETVAIRSLIASEKFQNAAMDLPIALGKTISNEIFIADLAKMPHLLMAGATGQGKSVGVNSILVSLLYKKHPSQIKFVLIDPKKVELSLYSTIEKHFLAKLPGEEEPIIVDTKKVVHTLKALCVEMDQRYDLLKNAQCRNIKEYNEKFLNRRLNPNNGHRFLPYIVLVIDEFADLIMTAGKEIETPIARLAQLARAIGIHLIIATQRPSVNIITGTIKANFPARIAFKVTSKVDSRTILDQGGADQLIGRGDLLLSIGGDTMRLQCGFVDTPEVDRVCEFISNQKGYPEAHLLPEVKEEDGEAGEYLNPNERDELFEEAAATIVQYQQGSTSLLQRRLKLGYNRAGRLMDQLESAGIVGPNQGSKARDVLLKDQLELEHFLTSLREKSEFSNSSIN